MSSAFFGLNTALRGLVASQTMLETAAHNTANASTPGFSRQRVALVESDPYTYPSFNRSGLPGQIGTGVTVATITRVRDAFIDLQLRDQSSIQGDWTARSDELSKVESVFPEPTGSGLGSVLAKFWGAWQDVAADPTSSGARSALVEQASTLAARFNNDASQLKALASGIDDQVRQNADTVTTLASQIAALNGQIQAVQVSGDHPNDLQDQRDLLLDQLAKIVPATLQSQADGTVTVLVGGADLVSGGRARAVSTGLDPNPASVHFGKLVPMWSPLVTVTLGGGQLAGLVNTRDVTLAGYGTQLDTLAAGVADAVNALHVTGFDAAGVIGLAFFSYTAGNAAATLVVNPAIVADASLVATASATGQPGDGSIAGRIADLQSGRVFVGGTQTASDFYASLIGTIGSDARQANEMASNQGLVTDHLRQRRESTSGVSLDEEATDMIRFQHAYSAAARVITTFDQMLDTLINRTGLVGR
jgi:flagellar hook-associated protein 1 FlgK